MRRHPTVKSTAAGAPLALALVANLLMTGSAYTAPPARVSATARFVSEEARGCIMTEVSVFVRGVTANQRVPRAGLRLRLLQVNECESIALLDIEAPVNLAADAFQVAPNLARATVEAATSVADKHSHRRMEADIRLTWTATEPAITAARTEEASEPGRFIRMKEPAQQAMRAASVSGRISIGSKTLTLQSAEAAWIASSVGGVPDLPGAE